MATASSDSDEDNNYDWEQTEDTEREASELSRASPLFSPFIKLPSILEACQHDEENFGFNIKNLCAELKVDFYGGIKLINYVRSLVKESLKLSSPLSLSEATCIIDKVKSFCNMWQGSDEFLKPVMKDDAFLQFVDSIIVDDDWSDDNSDDIEGSGGGGGGGLSASGSMAEEQLSELAELQKQLAATQTQLTFMRKILFDQKYTSNSPTALNGQYSYLVSHHHSRETGLLLNPETVQVYQSALLANRTLFQVKAFNWIISLHCPQLRFFNVVHTCLL